MSPNFKKLLFIYILFIFMAAEASAIGFERREEPEKEYGIYTFPVPIEVPGIQEALFIRCLTVPQYFSLVNIPVPLYTLFAEIALVNL